MKNKHLIVRILAILLCAQMLLPILINAVTASAEEDLWIPDEITDYGILDPVEMTRIVEDYCKAWGLNLNKISIGYCYLDTGDTWYYNPDKWYYSADLYKMPLAMLLSGWEADGRVTQETELIKGLSIYDLENFVLCYNSADYAHQVENLIGSKKECRKAYQSFTNLPKKYYSQDYYDYSYFTARFTTDVLKNLYYNPDQFPHIIDRMKEANIWEYFSGGIGVEYETAQKFGKFIDSRNVAYNHCTGIIYTEHPFALTVMTQDMGVSQKVIGDMAMAFKNYTLTLTPAYDKWAAAGNTLDPNKACIVYEPAEVEPAQTAEPAEEPAAEAPAETVTEEPSEDPLVEPPAETPSEEPAEEPPEEPAQTPLEEPEEQETAAPRPAWSEEELRSANQRLAVIILGLALSLILLLSWIARGVIRRKRAEEETR